MIFAGQEGTHLEPVDVSRLVEEMLELLKISISKRAILKIELGQDLPAVMGNATQIRQHEIHDLIPHIVRYPDPVQSSPSSFFNATYCTQAAIELRERQPDLKILFTSGTPMDAWTNSDLKNVAALPVGSCSFIAKPFLPEVLRQKVRKLLASGK
jgi:hypothetical protein